MRTDHQFNVLLAFHLSGESMILIYAKQILRNTRTVQSRQGTNVGIDPIYAQRGGIDAM